MEEGFATVSRNLAKAISEFFFKSVKADLEISYDEEIQLLRSNKICKRRKLIQMWTQNSQAYQYINERQTARGNTQKR